MKNKTYYYKKDVLKRSKMYGSTTYKITVYGIKAGKLYTIGTTEQNTASTPGDFGEVWHILRACGLVPKTSDVFDNAKICAYEYRRKNNIEVINIDNI